MEFTDSHGRGAHDAPDGSSPNWIEGHVLNPFVNALAIHPYNAAANVVNFVGDSVGKPELLDKKDDLPISQTTLLSPGWFAQNVSSGLGMVLPYVVAGKVAGSGLRGVSSGMGMTGEAATFMKSELTAQVTGAAMLDYSRDTQSGETRLGNAVGGALGFYVFGKGNALALTDSFAQRQIARVGIGSLGGVAQLTGSRLVSGEGLPTWNETLQAGVTGGALNLTLTPTQHGLGKGVELAGKAGGAIFHSKPMESVRGAYYRATWKVQDGKTAAAKSTYAMLNQLDMRHPIQRVGNFLNATDFSDVPIRAKLTSDNSPINAFEKELPEHFARVKKQEEKLLQAEGWEEKGEVYDAMKATRIDFAYKLLQMWHGSKEAPGIKSYTDSELQTAQVDAQRIAQIRNALTSSARRELGTDSDPMAKALAELVPEHLRPDDIKGNVSLADALSHAKERFFGYDENKIESMMSLPGFQHAAVRHFTTGIDWMTHQATPDLPNLFHGTVSTSFPSLFTEKSILNSKEMRLKGIQQATGESAGDEFPRRAISITRSFGEAFAYHRHSPDYLTSYPAVFGVSKEVIPQAWAAGMSEPGEILIDKLRLGTSAMTKLGLRDQEVTHLYVPDTEVGAVTRQLGLHRVKGLKVVGFGQLQQPKWNNQHPLHEVYKRNYPKD